MVYTSKVYVNDLIHPTPKCLALRWEGGGKGLAVRAELVQQGVKRAPIPVRLGLPGVLR